jgi:phenol hydroxylase P4 protein
MAVAAITENYVGERLDRVENFHGNQVLYVGWDHHLMFCAPVAFAVPPETPFSKVLEELIPGAFSLHPEFGEIDWNQVE